MFKWTKRFRRAANATEKNLAGGTFGIAKPPPGQPPTGRATEIARRRRTPRWKAQPISRGPATTADDLCDREAASWTLRLRHRRQPCSGWWFEQVNGRSKHVPVGGAGRTPCRRQRVAKLAARADADLGEHLMQVPLDRPRAEEEQRADLWV
jgi:hypothetical protein